VRQQVEALNLKYDEAFNQNDAEAVADLFTPDPVESGPEEAVSGQQEIQAQTPVIPKPRYQDQRQAAIGALPFRSYWKGSFKSFAGTYTPPEL
jgi:uncharacterized protein (TIGR02246 family)